MVASLYKLEGSLEGFRGGLGLWFRKSWACTTPWLPGKPNPVLHWLPQASVCADAGVACGDSAAVFLAGSVE